MKLLRYGPVGLERPGLLDDARRIRELSAHVHDIAGTTLLPANLQRLAAIDQARLPLVEEGVRIGPCVGKVGKLVCIERAGPQAELSLKATSALCGADDAVQVPRGARAVLCAPRLAVVVGRGGCDVAAEDALEHVAGYALLCDVQEEGAASRVHRDTFAPLGPWLVVGAVPPGVDVRQVVACASRQMSLQPGDVIVVPAPVADPGRRYALALGEERRFAIEGLGEQRLRAVSLEAADTAVT